MHREKGDGRDDDDEERRAHPADRDVVLNEADRALARVIVREILKHLGIKDPVEYREEQKLLKQILPMLVTMHEAYKWKRDLYRWWLTTTGKTIAWGFTVFVFFSILYGGIPAIRTMIAKVTT